MTVDLYDYIWAAQRRFIDTLESDFAANLTEITGADSSLDPLDLPEPEAYYPVDNEEEAAELRENHLCYGCVYPEGGDEITHLTGDLQTRTDEHLWTLVLAVALTQEAAAAMYTESWGDVPVHVRERRRLGVVLAAATNALARGARDGVNVIQSLPDGRPAYGVLRTDDGIVRWGRQAFSILSYTKIPQHGSTP